MDFDLSEDQQSFREAARDFAEREMAPHAAEWDREAIFPRETIAKAGELGFCGLYAKTDHGGLGLPRLDSAIVFEELAAAFVRLARTRLPAPEEIELLATWLKAFMREADEQAGREPGSTPTAAATAIAEAAQREASGNSGRTRTIMP